MSRPAYKARGASGGGSAAAPAALFAAGQRLPEPAATLGRLLPAAESWLPQTGTARVPVRSRPRQLSAGLFCSLDADERRSSSSSSLTHRPGSPGPGSHHTSPRPGRPNRARGSGNPPPRCPRVRPGSADFPRRPAWPERRR